MWRKHSKTDSELSFGSLSMAQEQRDILNDTVRQFIDEFTDQQPNAPAMHPTPSSTSVENWLDSEPSRNAISDVPQLNRIFNTLKMAFKTGVETSAGTQLSYVPGSALPSAALGRYLAASTNRYTGMSSSCPGAVALEQSVINWMTQLFGLESCAGGVLLSGGSMANFTAVVAARTQLGDSFANGTVYVAASAHHSIVKACRLAGIATNNVRRIPSDAKHKMDVDLLEKRILEDINAGFQPMLIVATAGTTDTGAVDPLKECAAQARRFGAWLHVDAAYGGFFALTQRGKEQLEGINEADSITVDAHKSLFIPFGVGALLVAERRKLTQANTETGHYLPDLGGKNELPDFCSLGPELSRPNRGLDIWLPLQIHGTDAFAQELDRMLDLAIKARYMLDNIAGIKVLNDPELSVVCFQCTDGDQATQQLLDALNDSLSVHVASTLINDKLVIRLAFLNYQTKNKVVDLLGSLIRKNMAEHYSSAHGSEIFSNNSCDFPNKNSWIGSCAGFPVRDCGNNT